jgi:hypothetical protein
MSIENRPGRLRPSRPDRSGPQRAWCLTRTPAEDVACNSGACRYRSDLAAACVHGAEGPRHRRAPASHGDVLRSGWLDGTFRLHGPGGHAPVYGWFTEGFDTRDLKEAKKLLDELQSAPATGLGIASSQT